MAIECENPSAAVAHVQNSRGYDERVMRLAPAAFSSR